MNDFYVSTVKKFLKNLRQYYLTSPIEIYTNEYAKNSIEEFLKKKGTEACICYYVFFYKDLQLFVEFKGYKYTIKPISKAIIEHLKFNKKTPKRYLWIDSIQ